ncbi:M12 family metallopeptidase [Spirosoma pulveris]
MANKKEGRTLDASAIVDDGQTYCALPPVPPRVFEPGIAPDRQALIEVMSSKWTNGTQLHYYFFDQPSDGQYVFFTDGSKEWRLWTTSDEKQKDVVRQAFDVWKGVGIGIEFVEVKTRGEAEIRIGFMQGDGSWSFIGRDILDKGKDQRTMNFGWDLTRNPKELDTAVHEIGHTLGFPHEHQNPNSGIVWDEDAVYKALALPPNSWSKEKTFYNIIQKIAPDTVKGSNWDPNSVMHYPFGPGLIKAPTAYQKGVFPHGGLSDWDKTWVREFYPQLTPHSDPALKPFESFPLDLAAGAQQNFVIEPADTRYYTIQVFGTSDVVAALFEEIEGEYRFKTADDDSGHDRNATIRIKLFKGRRYKLRVRMYYSGSQKNNAVMIW